MKVKLREILILTAFFHFYFTFPSACAAQVFAVKNNGVVSATASLKELTRIAFEDDEVDSIYGLSGEMTYEVKNNNLFIKLKSEKTINFFILTKNANVYKVILRPKDIKATQLFIRNTITKEQMKRMKQDDPSNGISFSEENLLRQNIAAIIRVALANENKAGFEVDSDETNLGKYGLFHLKELSVWTGRGLTAKKILVTNTKDMVVALSRKDFRCIKLKNFRTQEFRPLAVYLEKTSLQPFESTYLLLITKSE